MSDMRELIRGMTRESMEEGGKLALDSAIRAVGRLVEKFTVGGHAQAAAGASGAMELLKQLRDATPDLYRTEPQPSRKEGT